MHKYMFIFHTDGPIEMAAETGATFHTWFEGLGDKLIDGGGPFNPKSEAMVKAGEVTNDVDTAGGYAIVSAENLGEAIELAKTCPMSTLPGCGVKVYETMPM